MLTIVGNTDPCPDPPDHAEQEERLREHLERAHRANAEARVSIEAIAKELRFPLTYSTRVKEVRGGDNGSPDQ